MLKYHGKEEGKLSEDTWDKIEKSLGYIIIIIIVHGL